MKIEDVNVEDPQTVDEEPESDALDSTPEGDEGVDDVSEEPTEETEIKRLKKIESFVRRAYDEGKLEASPGLLELLRIDEPIPAAKVSDDAEPAFDFLVCEKCATAIGLGADPCECPTCGSEMTEAMVVKAIEGRLDFEQGDEGTGILQTHERGLTEDQAKLLDGAFGWEPVALSQSQLSRLSELHSADWGSLVKTAAEGDSKPLAKAVSKIDREGLSMSDRKLIALVGPVSIHTDFRMRPEGADYWEGGEGFTPGNQFKTNKIREIAEGTAPDGAKVLGNFKVVREGEGLKPRTIRGPLAWMKVGDGEPEVFPPDAAGSTSEAWSRFLVIDKYGWRAGIQDSHFKEFEFEGKILKGRWVFQYVPVDGDRREWMISRPKDQQLKADTDAKKPEAEEKGKERSFVIDILKAEKRLVTGVVLQPEVPDGQGDIYSEEVIESAAHRFMESYLERRAMLGIQHKDYSKDLELVESYTAPSDMIVNGQAIKSGSWIMTIKVNDDVTWKKVKTGELTGLSIKGKVRVIKLDTAA